MNKIEVTEFVRFNDDGSSDHIQVVGDELLSTEHCKVSPYVRVPRCFQMNPLPLQDNEIVEWMVRIHPINEDQINEYRNRSGQ